MYREYYSYVQIRLLGTSLKAKVFRDYKNLYILSVQTVLVQSYWYTIANAVICLVVYSLSIPR